MKEIRSLFTQTIIYGFGTIVPRILNYSILTPFYTRVLTTGEYGTFSFFYAYVSLFLVILTYGMETAFFKFFNNEKYNYKVFGTSVISLLFTSILFVFVAFYYGNQIAELISYKNHPEYVYVLGLVVAIDAFSSILFAKLRVENKALKFSIIKFSNVIITISSIFFAFNYADNLFGNMFQTASDKVFLAFFCNLLGSFFCLIILIPEFFKTKFIFCFKLLKKMLKYSYPLLFVGICGVINENIDKIVLKYLLPDDIANQNVGIYAASYKIAVLMTLFIQMFRYAAEPFFFSTYKKAGESAKSIYARVMKYFIVLGFLNFLSVTFYIDIIQCFIGEEFRSGIGIVPIVILGNLFLGIYFNLSIWYKLENKTLYCAFIAFIGAIITLSINFIFIPIVGYYASAWATFFCYLIMMIISYFLGQKHYKINYPIESISLYSLTAISLFFISEFINFQNLITKLIIHTFFILYFLLLVYLKEKSDKSKSLFR